MSEINKESLALCLKNLYLDMCLKELEENPHRYLSLGPEGYKFDYEKLDTKIMQFLDDYIRPEDIKEHLDDTALKLWRLRYPHNCIYCGGDVVAKNKFYLKCKQCKKEFMV